MMGTTEDLSTLEELAAEQATAADPLHYLKQLPENADAREVERALRHLQQALRHVDSIARLAARDEAIRLLKKVRYSAPAKMVDAALDGSGEEAEPTQGSAIALSEPMPFLFPVEGAAVLAEISCAISRYIALAPEAVTGATLWVMLCFVYEAFNILPLLAIMSPVKRCGKTTLLKILSALVPRSLLSSNISSAALFRTIEKYRPTLFIDEADTFLGAKEELRGIINSGHTRATSFVIRAVGDDYEPRRFSTWGPKAIAQIGELAETVADRSIIIKMRRRKPTERVERLREDDLLKFDEIRSKAARWARDNIEELRNSNPHVPDGITSDRAADNWRPLFSIADAAGAEWPQLARRAASSLQPSTVDDSEGVAIMLLNDLREFWSKTDDAVAWTDEILEFLNSLKERPWPEFRRGKPMSDRQLARLLKKFDVEPTAIRKGPVVRRGYYMVGPLADAIHRYMLVDTLQPLHDSSETTSTLFGELHDGET